MLLSLELNALGKYLNPSKAKLESKGVDSVISRVMNLQETSPGINHDSFCKALEEMFVRKYAHEGVEVNSRVLTVEELEQIPKLMEIYKTYSDWSWRFGQTPDFKNSLEKKF